MGKRGPKPKPARLKALAGNPGKRPLSNPSAGTRFKADTLEWWGNTLGGLGKATWDALAPEMIAAGTLDDGSAPILGAYCLETGRYYVAIKALADDPGNRQWQGVAHQTANNMLKLGAVLGLDPAHRDRLPEPPKACACEGDVLRRMVLGEE